MTWPTPPSGSKGSDPAGRHEPDTGDRSDFDRGARSLGDTTGEKSQGGLRRVVARHPSGLVITDVQVRPVNDERLRAWVTITLNDAFVVKGIRIIQGNTRLFVAMPSRQQKDGSFQDVAHPIHPDFREYLENRILGAFRERCP